MKVFATIMAGAALASTGSATLAGDVAEKGEARLAEMLEGRIAGEPVRCITTFHSDSPQIIDRVALVHREGRTIYVGRPERPRSLDSRDILLIERFSSSQLCANDQMRMIDRTGGFTTGLVFVKEFVPYTEAG
jgi:hypothetical protein